MRRLVLAVASVVTIAACHAPQLDVRAGASNAAAAAASGTPLSTCAFGAAPFTETPLVASWPSGEAAALDAAMSKGIAVVAYDGCAMKVLTHCKVSGSYRFVGSEPAAGKAAIADEKALRSQVFGDHQGLSSKLKGGAKLELELSAVGSLESNKTIVLPTSLSGDCEGATHYVTAALLGSYAFKSGGALVDGEATPAVCATASPKDKTAKAGCDHKLRVHLAAVRAIEIPATKTHDKSACPDDSALACTKACAGANMSACTTLGWMLEKGTSVLPGDPARAAMLYRAACFAGQQLACNNLAMLFLEGRGIDKDASQAAPLFRMACSGGDVRACANLGTLYRDGNGVGKDSARAVALFKKACDSGDGEACGMLGKMQDVGEGTPRDPALASASLAKGCVLRDADSCNNLGVSLIDAPADRRNEPAALRLFQLACTGGLGVACRNLGNLQASGLGVPIDKTGALASWEAGCALGHSDACERAAGVLVSGKDRGKGLALLEAAKGKGSPTAFLRLAQAYDADPKKAFSLLRKGCEAGASEACTRLVGTAAKAGPEGLKAVAWLEPLCKKGQHAACTALADFKVQGLGGPKDPAGASKRYQQACEAGETVACARGATLLLQTPKVPLDGATKMLDRACERGDAGSCKQVAQLFSVGARVPRDEKRAAASLELGCLAPDASACLGAAELFEAGKGVAAAPTKAQALYARACNAGLEAACAKAKQLPAAPPPADPLGSAASPAPPTSAAPPPASPPSASPPPASPSPSAAPSASAPAAPASAPKSKETP